MNKLNNNGNGKRLNVVNVNKLMHENTLFRKGLFGKRFNVSPGAVHEFSVRIMDRIGDYTPLLCKIARRHDRLTVQEEDVIELFSYVGMDPVGEVE